MSKQRATVEELHAAYNARQFDRYAELLPPRPTGPFRNDDYDGIPGPGAVFMQELKVVVSAGVPAVVQGQPPRRPRPL